MDFLKTYSDTKRDRLMRRVNDLLGREVIQSMYDRLTVQEFTVFQMLLEAGQISLHTDGWLGFTCECHDGAWTNEGFTQNSSEDDSCLVK